MPRTLKDAACGFVASGSMAAATVMTGLLADEAAQSPDSQLTVDPLVYLSSLFGVITAVTTALVVRHVRTTHAQELQELRAQRAQEPLELGRPQIVQAHDESTEITL
jgi:hypothetical protein